jgi:hypothetical protein
MSERTIRHEASVRGSSAWSTMRPVVAAIACGLVFGFVLAAAPAGAQGRGKSDPIGHSTDLSTKPRPGVPAPPEPRERIVPEQRVRDPITGKEVVVPQHYEGPGQPQPSTGYGTKGEGPVLAPPKDSR